MVQLLPSLSVMLPAIDEDSRLITAFMVVNVVMIVQLDIVYNIRLLRNLRN